MVADENMSGKIHYLGDGMNQLVASTRSGVGRAKCNVVSDAELISRSLDRFDCKEDVLKFEQVHQGEKLQLINRSL